MTDWNKEAEQLGSSNFWKPQTGQYTVKFLDDGTPSTYEDKNSGRVTEQLNFKVEIDGEEKEWTVTKARTVNSLYGQIALLGRYHGSLVEKTITLLVKFDQQNNKREYTVQEALDLITEYNQQREPKKQAKTKKEEPTGPPSVSSRLDRIFSDEMGK
jgi:hypothetical protein